MREREKVKLLYYDVEWSQRTMISGEENMNGATVWEKMALKHLIHRHLTLTAVGVKKNYTPENKSGPYIKLRHLNLSRQSFVGANECNTQPTTQLNGNVANYDVVILLYRTLLLLQRSRLYIEQAKSHGFSYSLAFLFNGMYVLI